MSQISLPVRILLIGAVVFLAAWFAILRPKPESVTPATTTTTTSTQPATTGPGKAVEAARKAARQAAGTAEPKTETKSGAVATATPTAKAETVSIAIPAAALAKFPKDVSRALKARDVLVLAVLADGVRPWRPLADDDRFVRNALRHVNRYGGEVLVKRVPASKLATYGSLVNELDVHQTPSVVIVDRNLKGTVLTGYVDRGAVNQAIANARRVSIVPNITNAYLRWANQRCGQYETLSNRWSRPAVGGKSARKAAAKRRLKIVTTFRQTIASKRAPGWRTLKAQWVGVLTSQESILAAQAASGSLADLTATFDTLASRKLDRRFDKVGLTDCSIRRTS